jgi:uncharacterized protein (TIGR03086 family)
VDDIALLDGVMAKAGDVITGVRTDQWELPTPCRDWDVRALVGHIVGWLRVFAAGANGEAFEGDPGDYQAGERSAEDFRRLADSLVAGWRAHGTDRTVRLTSGEMPAPMVLDMTLMEYMTHGWDLATATGQPVPFTDSEADDVLRRARVTLRPEYRGPDTAMGEEVEAPAGAAPIVRLAAFMGRDVVDPCG